MPRTILLPYHLDERLPADTLALPTRPPPIVVDPVLPDGGSWRRLATLHDALAAEVAGAASPGQACVVVTGDCLAALGTLAGMQRSGVDPSLVWFDAHGDLHLESTSTSGYLAGMPLRMAVGGDPDLLGGPLRLRPVAEERVTLVGARELDPPEEDFLGTSAIRRTTVEEISTGDVSDGPVLLHVDLDVLDPGELSGLRFPAPSGPTLDALVEAVGRLVASGHVAALDIACPWVGPTSAVESAQRSAVLESLLATLPAR